MTADTAFKVSSVKEEYQILQALGLEVKSQALMSVKGKNFDLFVATDANGITREVWFDTSKFYLAF